jgi:two-component system KDP operon response regulator KdpE
MTRVLVVDDEPHVLLALQTNLRGAGYEVAIAASAREALQLAEENPPDAVVLDLVLPDGLGTDVCRRLRVSSAVPILVLSALGEEAEKVAALDAGADDYVTKPFGVEELLARLRALLRRSVPASEPTVTVGDVSVDFERSIVTVRGERTQLTPTEFQLLSLLVRSEGKLLTHSTMLREVWGYGAAPHYLHVYVSQLRRKIEIDPARPRHLLTEPSVGYRFVAPS